MPLTENDIKAELSYAYLHAIAARAGMGCQATDRHTDNAGVDAYIRVKERLDPNSILTNFPFEVQLKATSKTPALETEKYSYCLDDVKRYDELRERSGPMPKLLVVLFLPKNIEDWLTQTEEELITRRCAYWTSLWDAPPTTGKSGKTVYLPKANVLSVSGLRAIARQLSREEELTYAG